MSLTVILIMIVFAVLFSDWIAKLPGLIVQGLDFIGHINAKTFAIIILIIAGIWLMLKKRK